MSDLPSWNFHSIPSWVDNFRWLGIVGARSFLNPRWEEIATEVIYADLEQLDIPDREMGIVSGGAAGIDSLGERIADKEWYRKCIFPPKTKTWPDFRARNELIGQVSTWVLGIRCESTKTWGTGHMCEYAESLGKPVARRVIHNNPRCEGCPTDRSWKGKRCD